MLAITCQIWPTSNKLKRLRRRTSQPSSLIRRHSRVRACKAIARILWITCRSPKLTFRPLLTAKWQSSRITRSQTWVALILNIMAEEGLQLDWIRSSSMWFSHRLILSLSRSRHRASGPQLSTIMPTTATVVARTMDRLEPIWLALASRPKILTNKWKEVTTCNAQMAPTIDSKMATAPSQTEHSVTRRSQTE